MIYSYFLYFSTEDEYYSNTYLILFIMYIGCNSFFKFSRLLFYAPCYLPKACFTLIPCHLYLNFSTFYLNELYHLPNPYNVFWICQKPPLMGHMSKEIMSQMLSMILCLRCFSVLAIYDGNGG